MGKKNVLVRGFKANAERLAKDYREKLEIHPCDPLCAFKLAGFLKIPVYKATEIFENIDEATFKKYKDLLAGTNGKEREWSALTIKTKAENRIIIHNPFHSDARQQSDMMHEIAHIICNHSHATQEYDFPIPVGLRGYNEVQEEEAKCLGGTLQLSSPCLLWAKKRSMSYDEIANYFNASYDMVKYRMNITGIARRPVYN